MQVKNKIFPYPVLNHNKDLSDFGDIEFKLEFDKNEDDEKLCLDNIRFVTNSNLINELYDNNKIDIYLIIECSQTVCRKAYKINNQPGNTIKLYKADFVEKVDVSMFAVAKEELTIKSNEFFDSFGDLEFKLEKYDILAANDGFNVRFQHDKSESNLVSSIFSVIPSKDLEPGAYVIDCNLNSKITITLSEKEQNNYKIICSVPTYKEVFFNMLLVPALIEGLSLCKSILVDDSKDLEDVGNQYYWFRSILSSYKKLKGTDLTVDEFKQISSATLAQELLGKPLGEALDKLVLETNGVKEDM